MQIYLPPAGCHGHVCIVCITILFVVNRVLINGIIYALFEYHARHEHNAR